MDEVEMLKLFYTMHFADGTVKSAKKVNQFTLYLEMFNEPDLVFLYYGTGNWSLQTAKNYIERLPFDVYLTEWQQDELAEKILNRKVDENGTNGNT